MKKSGTRPLVSNDKKKIQNTSDSLHVQLKTEKWR